MEDPVLNCNLDETKELQTRWSQFHDFCKAAMQQGQKKITPQAEMKFLELKSRIAMLHDSFMDSLKHEQKVGQNIMQIASDCILLKRVAIWSDAESQKFEFDWNECFMLMNEQLSSLEEEQKRLAGISERAWNASKRRERIQATIHNFLHSAGFKFAVISLVLFMVLYGIPALGIYDYRRLHDTRALVPAYNIFVNYVYRPYFSNEIEYQEIGDVQENTKYNPLDTQGIERADPVTLDRLTDTILPQYVSRDKLAEVKQLISASLGPPVCEHYLPNRQDAKFFSIVFNNLKDTHRFVELVRAGWITKSDALKDQLFIYRRANFIAIGFSIHGMRQSHPMDKWKLKEHSNNELAK